MNVEVKGTTRDGAEVILAPNEFRYAGVSAQLSEQRTEQLPLQTECAILRPLARR